MSGTAIRRLYVANRGEIARRIATTATRLGITAVVPDLDAADAVDLLDPGSVVTAARAAGCDAVHPGYGFLAESPALAEAVIEAGLLWVGPPPAAIRTLGDKAAARSIARQAGVPVADGEEPEDQSDASLVAAAGRIGLPIVVKPAAGGGGKGIRVVALAEDLAPALAAARREAGRSFGDERLLLERYVVGARHVEVQVLADASGGVVHLGDRDCSLQRRHQKVLEEAPAPGLEDSVRRGLWDAAVRLAAAVGYVNAGTCEFLVDDAGGFVFLEMNARLQVEHPVTELILGGDLVADQLGITGGASLADLGIEQGAVEAALARGGHAIEVRINAEDPAAGFLPSAGRVAAVRWPRGAVAFGPVGLRGTRVDAGIEEGSVVGGRFDPLLAKVIARGSDRPAAMRALGDALEGTEVLGLPTNLAFLRRLVAVPAVVDARARTDTLDGDPDAIAAAGAGATPTDDAWSAAARAFADESGERETGEAWGEWWRMNSPRRVPLVADLGDELVERSVELDRGGSERQPFAVRDGETVHVSVAGRSVPFTVRRPPTVEEAEARRRVPSSGAGPAAIELLAPMPGTVLTVHAAAGVRVASGDPVVTLEAMKMEHVVAAPRDGHLEEVRVTAGGQVIRGQPLARLRSEG